MNDSQNELYGSHEDERKYSREFPREKAMLTSMSQACHKHVRQACHKQASKQESKQASKHVCQASSHDFIYCPLFLFRRSSNASPAAGASNDACGQSRVEGAHDVTNRIIRIRVAQDCESWGLCTHGYAWLWTQRGIRLLDDSFPIAVNLSTPLHSVNS